MSRIFAFKPTTAAALCRGCLLCVAVASATVHAEQDAAVEGKVDKSEATIWLEEKIAPSSNWLEELVQPMTSWMEERLHGEAAPQEPAVAAPKDATDSGTDAASVDVVFIDAALARQVAQEAFPGDVLHSKLLSASQRYRIKLLTAQGVIHVVYVDAVTAALLPQEK